MGCLNDIIQDTHIGQWVLLAKSKHFLPVSPAQSILRPARLSGCLSGPGKASWGLQADDHVLGGGGPHHDFFSFGVKPCVLLLVSATFVIMD